MNNIHRKRSTILVVASLLSISLVFIYLGSTSRLRNDPPTNPREREIHELRQVLTKRNLSDQMRHSLDEKLEIEERIATQRVIGHRASKDPDNTPTLIPVTQSRQPTGIIDKIQGIFYSRGLKIVIIWQDFIKGELVQVAAGAYTNDVSQGIVIVRNLTTHIGDKFYEIPKKTGTVHVATVTGNQLSLKTSQGVMYIFDISEQQLVSSDGELIPPTRLLQYPPRTSISMTPTAYPSPPRLEFIAISELAILIEGQSGLATFGL